MLQTALNRLSTDPVKMDAAMVDEQFEETFRDAHVPTMWLFNIWTYRV